MPKFVTRRGLSHSEAGRMGVTVQIANGTLYGLVRQREMMAAYADSPKKCPKCDAAIPYLLRRNKFCNHSCAATTTNAGRRRREVERPCLRCGQAAANRSAFCSKACADADLVDRWQRGEISGNTPSGPLCRFVRLWLLAEADYKCQQCRWAGINPFHQRTALQVHHLDGDWRNERPENLQILCPNCHAMTENFMGRGKGREWRKDGAKSQAGTATTQ